MRDTYPHLECSNGIWYGAHCAKRRIFGPEFVRIRNDKRSVYDSILRYSFAHDATYTEKILLESGPFVRIQFHTLEYVKMFEMHTTDCWSLMVRFDHLWTLAFPSDLNTFAYSHVFKSVFDPRERHFSRIRARILTNMWGIRYASPRTPNVPPGFAYSLGGCGVLKLQHSRTLLVFQSIWPFYAFGVSYSVWTLEMWMCITHIFTLGYCSIRSCIRFILFVILIFQQVHSCTWAKLWVSATRRCVNTYEQYI